MKDNNHMLHGGKLLPEYYDAWALYYTKFIKAYEAKGIPVWGITIQNEPMAVQRWESCVYSAEEERDFLKNHLGPMMEREGLGDKNIVVWDHNRDLMVNRANTIFDDPEAAKYAWGIGFHWYEKWTGGAPMYNNLTLVKESYPDKELLFTEGCQEMFDADKLQHWPHAERYGESIINDFNAGTSRVDGLEHPVESKRRSQSRGQLLFCTHSWRYGDGQIDLHAHLLLPRTLFKIHSSGGKKDQHGNQSQQVVEHLVSKRGWWPGHGSDE